jgi:hypothetical protein
MLAAPIMIHGVMFTLFGVFTVVLVVLAHLFTYTITFEGRGWEVGKGRLPIGQVTYRTPADWLYCVV